jgi:hypothetical protein
MDLVSFDEMLWRPSHGSSRLRASQISWLEAGASEGLRIRFDAAGGSVVPADVWYRCWGNRTLNKDSADTQPKAHPLRRPHNLRRI